MTDIKKILDEIDGLREKLDDKNKDWSKEREIYSHDEARYLGLLNDSYPTLRDYIARLERESEAMADAIESVYANPNVNDKGCVEFNTLENGTTLLSEAQRKLYCSLVNYRKSHTACEGEETK